MVRQIFKGKVIAAAGPLPDQLTPQNLQQWTKVRKGTFTHEIDETVTHLLCTREQFNKKVGRGMSPLYSTLPHGSILIGRATRHVPA